MTSKIACNSKTIEFREFCINMLFSYFWVSYDIVELQTCGSLDSQVIATLRLSLLSKLLVSSKLLHLAFFYMFLCTFGSAITL